LEELKKTRILAVCRIPLGGIRTYIKYNYKYFPKDQYEITLLTIPTLEKEALIKDMNDLGINVVMADNSKGNFAIIRKALSILFRNKYDIIHSHGYRTAVYMVIANLLSGLPHILTTHGIMEPN